MLLPHFFIKKLLCNGFFILAFYISNRNNVIQWCTNILEMSRIIFLFIILFSNLLIFWKIVKLSLGVRFGISRAFSFLVLHFVLPYLFWQVFIQIHLSRYFWQLLFCLKFIILKLLRNFEHIVSTFIHLISLILFKKWLDTWWLVHIFLFYLIHILINWLFIMFWDIFLSKLLWRSLEVRYSIVLIKITWFSLKNWIRWDWLWRYFIWKFNCVFITTKIESLRNFR